MKKKLLFLVFTLFFTCTMVFAQTHSTVKLSDDIYNLLEDAETRGLCTELSTVRPYTQKYIISKLEEIAETLVNNKTNTSEKELKIVRKHIERLSNNNKTDPKSLKFVTSNNNDNLALTFGIKGTVEGLVSGGIYTKSEQNSIGFEEWNTLGIFGDIGPYLSFDWDGGIDFTKMPLTKMGDNYFVGNWWNETSGTIDLENNPRYISSFKNFSVLPYSYFKHWDGSVYFLSKFDASGLEGWPNPLSFGMTMQGAVEASFFNNRLYLGISRKNREWGAMDSGAGLALNANARPFLGMEANFKLFDWLSFGALTGFLEWPNQEYIQKDAWYLTDSSGKPHKSGYPWTSDAYFFQTMFGINIINFDFKYFHFDFGSTVIFPKRFELGYLFPIFEKVVYQNNIGDFDNLGLFGSIEGRLPGLGSIWLSGFIDELNAPNIKTMFHDTRCMFALQTGFKSIFPFLPLGSMSFRYTKVEPFCYTHNSIKTPYNSKYVSTAYVNNGAPLGYYLEPNSDEFIFRIDGRPVTNLDVGFQYQLVRHGVTWGPGSIEGSSIYSELAPTNRDNHHKYFLRDGVYEWTNMVVMDASYDLRGHGLPMKFSASAGYVYNWFTKSGSYNTPGDLALIEQEDPLYDFYPITSGLVLSLGFKFFAF